MAERAAVNASPLIFLARAGLLELLQLASTRVVVPHAVAQEIERRGAGDVTVNALARTSWLERVAPLAVPPVIEARDLGEGESGVLAWAYAQPGTLAIIDDLAARKCAESLQIPVKGTLGLVLLAKKCGVIPQAGPTMDKLRSAGLYLSDGVLRHALGLVGE